MTGPLKGWIRMIESGIEQQFAAEYLEWQGQNDSPEAVYRAEYSEGQYIHVRVLRAAPQDQQIVAVSVDGVDDDNVEYDLQCVE